MTIVALLTKLRSLRARPRRPIDARNVATDRPADNAVLKLLNDALATELVCMLRNRHHYFVTRELQSQSIAQKFLDHANEALHDADRLAVRIVQLGGTPDFAPEGMMARSQVEYVEGYSLRDRLRENMMGKQFAINHYRCLIQFLKDQDPTTRSLLNDVMARAERHGDELADHLVALHMRRQLRWPSPLAAGGRSLS